MENSLEERYKGDDDLQEYRDNRRCDKEFVDFKERFAPNKECQTQT